MNANEKNETYALIAAICERDFTCQSKNKEEIDEITNFIAQGFGCKESSGLYAMVKAYALGFMSGYDLCDKFDELSSEKGGGDQCKH